MDTFLGHYYAVLSIIIVYHLFSIQLWLERVATLESSAEELRMTTGVGDMARERMRTRLTAARSRFPWTQVVVIFLAVTALSYLAIKVALAIPTVPYFLSITPTIILWLVFVASTVSSWRQGIGRIDATVSRL